MVAAAGRLLGWTIQIISMTQFHKAATGGRGLPVASDIRPMPSPVRWRFSTPFAILLAHVSSRSRVRSCRWDGKAFSHVPFFQTNRLNMPIEFACHQCETRLRVRDDAAGKQARCPKCATMLVVPVESTPTRAAHPVAATPAGRVQPQSKVTASPEAGGPGHVAPEINPYASPAFASPAASAPGPLQAGKLDLGRILSETWDVYIKQKKFGWCMLAFFIMVIILGAFSFISDKLTVAVASARVPGASVVLFFLLLCGQLVLQQWLNFGMLLFTLRIARNEDPEMATLFRGHPYLLRGIGFTLLMVLLFFGLGLALVAVPAMLTTFIFRKPDIGIYIGWVLMIAPLVYVALVYSQVNYLIVDRNAGLFEAMRQSMHLTRGQLPMLFLVLFVLVLAGGSGALAIVILSQIAGTDSPLGLLAGFVATFPFAILGMTVTYLHLTSQAEEWVE